jgi:hypothetical protein
MRKVTVFYAWQSDTHQRFNRHLIRMALEMAARRLNADKALNVELTIDSDTQGVPGQPPITDTILKKISACDIFAPDLTFVAQTEGGKFIPNPNVMVEYGYALRAKSQAAMLPIMNTAFGPPENLPFDMGHLRHPIQYYVSAAAKNAERRTARKTLSEKLEEALRVTVVAQIAKAREDNPFKEAAAERPPAFFFPAVEVVATAGYPGEQEFRFNFDCASYIRLFPSYADQPPVGLAKLPRVFDMRKPCPMSTTIGGIPSRNKFGPVIHDPIGQSELWALTQGFASGELWGLNGQVFAAHPRNNPFAGTTDAITVIPIVTFEKIYSRVIRNYVQILTGELQLRFPYTVELGASGLDGVYLAVPVGGPFTNGAIEGPIMQPSLQKRYTLSDTTKAAINAVLRAYFTEVYDLVALARADALNDEVVATHNLPPR